MADGLNEHQHDPMRWAIGTVLEGNTETDRHSAEELVENVWEFISESCLIEGLAVPDKATVVREVEARLRCSRLTGQ